MFQELTSRFESIFRKLKGHGKITPENIAETMREVRRVLLEADVNFKVAKDFITAVEKKAVGAEVLKSITPGQQVIKIIYDELVLLLGGSDAPLREANLPPTVIMVVGLQGSGKTTFCGKLAKYLKSRSRRPMLVAADLQRPAAVEQLRVVAEAAEVDFFSIVNSTPLEVCRASIGVARQRAVDTVLLDTAGRLHINDELMQELEEVKKATKPHEILFVADAMTGQDAVNTAQAFLQRLDFTGVVLTKMDGDARGGAALSIKAVTGKPIKFIGVGEKVDALEKFQPERMASRILGMGDIVTLVEKASEAVDMQKAAELEKKLRRAEFTLEDFYEQLQSLKKMGPLSQLLNMIPGLGGRLPQEVDIDERGLVSIEAIILSMTPEERRRPHLINGSRRLRIAKGSGTSVQEVNRLLKQYEMMRKMLKQAGRKGRRGLPLPF
ncbi:MAG: signal recognition particle protein [candidate division KSB1 bacterium]|nr:signal recognition particle protein [candidate division KSB1 bacterium]MDZ7301267.1 signal recognition particle protein [candidate division KSB1 bacterium]MDZ7310510.1 signal recognition particle protein [candidate division KSB1 bacterium]